MGYASPTSRLAILEYEMFLRFFIVLWTLSCSSAAFGSTEKLTLAGFETGETVSDMANRVFPGVSRPFLYSSTMQGKYGNRTTSYGQYLVTLRVPPQVMGHPAIGSFVIGDGAPTVDPGLSGLPEGPSKDIQIKAWVAGHESSKILAVVLSFESSAYQDLATAAVAKYGKPRSSGIKTLSNAMGVKFDSRWESWVDSYGNELNLQERDGNVNTCVLRLDNVTAMGIQEARIKAILLKSSGI
jgi:hypothetical protein